MRAILEITDGVAGGPLHQPVPVDASNNKFSELEPLRWPTMCGTTGYVYERAGLEAMGHVAECLECRIVLLQRGELPRDLARELVRETRRRQNGRRRGVCRECHGQTSRPETSLCAPCYKKLREPPHGTPARYTSTLHKCRCDLCREATSQAQRERRQRMRAA